MEQMVRRSQQIKQRVFNAFRKVKQKKEIKSEFFARMCYFYHDYILKKYFNIIKNQQELKWEYQAQKQRVIIFWKQNMLKKYFYHLKQAKIVKLSNDRVVQKKVNICKLIFKKTHGRIFIQKLRENVNNNKELKEKYSHININKERTYFNMLKQYREKKIIQKQRIKLADNYNEKRLGDIILKKYFAILNKFANNNKEYKRKSQLLKSKMAKKYFNQFISQLEYNFNVNIFYADRHYESKVVKSYFSALKLYQRIIHYHKIKSQKKNKLLLKETFNVLRNYWKKAKLETKKSQLITRSKSKFIKQFVFRKLKEQFQIRQAQQVKEKDVKKISNQCYLRKSFEILRSHKNKQQLKKDQNKMIDKFTLQKYFKYFKQLYLSKQSKQEKERIARKYYFFKTVSSGFRQMKQLYLSKQKIVSQIIQIEKNKNTDQMRQIFQVLADRRVLKQQKRSKYSDFLNQQLIQKKSVIFQAFKSYSKSKFLKYIDQNSHKKRILNGFLSRVIIAWKNQACIKKNTRIFFKEKESLILKKIGFKRLQKNIQEVRVAKQKLRGLKLKKMIKMKKLIFTHMKQFLWKKQIKKQDLKDKENIYLAKILLKALYAWRIYLKALRRAKQKIKYAVVHWSTQRKKISFKKMKEFIQIKRQKRQEELDAFNLHVSHQQNEVLKKIIMVGLQLKEKKILRQKEDVVKIKLREQDLAIKYGRKWLYFYERRKGLRKQTNKQNVQRVTLKHQQNDKPDLQNVRMPTKDTLVFDKSNNKNHQHYMSFFPNQLQNKESFNDNSQSDDKQQQQKQQFQKQSTPQQPSFKPNPTFRVGSEDQEQEILQWFNNDFLQKDKMVPKKIGSIQQAQNNQKTILLNKFPVQEQQINVNFKKSIQQNAATTKQQQQQQLISPLEYQQQQQQGNNYSNNSYLNKSIQQKIQNISQTNMQNAQQYGNPNTLHLSNIAQLLDQDHSTTIIEDIKEKNKQLEYMIAEYQQKRNSGDQLRAAQLKPLIQEKLMEIKQLKNNI